MSMNSRRFAIRSSLSLLVAAFAHIPWTARADGANAARLQYSNTLGVQVNPRGFGDEVRARFRHPLYAGHGPLFEQNFVSAVAGIGLSPAALQPKLGVELQPVAALTLGVFYQLSVFTGALDTAQSYASPRADYSSAVFGPPRDGPGGATSLLVHRLVLNASVQAKFGSFFVRNATNAVHVDTSLEKGNRVFYDPVHDLAVYRRGCVVQNDSDAGFFFGKDLFAGLRHTLVATWYPSAAYAAEEPLNATDSPTSRVGPLLNYTLFDGRSGLVQSASIAVLLQWHLAHRFRTGERTSQAVPQGGVTFTVAGELIP